MKILLITLSLFTSLSAYSAQRVISTAPSVTNIIKALGKEELIVGVSPYCEISEKLPVVGTGLAFNYERALSLKTDLVIIPKLAVSDLDKRLKKMNIPTLVVDHDSISGVMESVLKISEALDVKEKGQVIFDRMITESKKRKRSNLKALFVVSADVSNGKIKDMYVAGRRGLYGEIVVLAGHLNVASELATGYPKINLENLIKLNPDIIFYLSSKDMPKDFSNAMRSIKGINAVSNNRVIEISGAEFGVPDHNISKLVEVMGAYRID
ncbi:oligopeptide ABC transporter, oligopeptide-binding protein [Bacteriovorax sp. BSW11_IV]|uniref:ABC transporter substrate-binding protein n=1 Tax=Bacteriovorax sp. BSW11_IV TaxID=1353529 RepID=UPI00038A5381|nr:ABC transporter substrate-binding protein [Bacteriovorax sp. BSW11_IV]EQC48380.1 oligopeptide ABC transporter, oligopeptide-binding protein [Bacteriovorax sp. BSW11_IV]